MDADYIQSFKVDGVAREVCYTTLCRVEFQKLELLKDLKNPF